MSLLWTVVNLACAHRVVPPSTPSAGASAAAATELRVDFLYPQTPHELPSAVVIGMPGGEARRVSPEEIREVRHWVGAGVESIDLQVGTESIRVMEGANVAGFAQRLENWTGAELLRLDTTSVQGGIGGIVARPGQVATTPDPGLIGAKASQVGSGGMGIDPGAPAGMPYWYYPIILGALDKRVMDSIIWAESDAIGACLGRDIPHNDQRGGQLTVKFRVAKSGDVETTEVRASTLGSREVEHCVAAKFQAMQFPRPVGGGIVIATYSMMLTPE